ncbi:hypothetical protein GCM10025776_26220 [Corallincola platygyrae]
MGCLKEISWVQGKPLFIHNNQYVLLMDHHRGQKHKIYVVDIRDITQPKISDIISVTSNQKKANIREYKLNHAADKLYMTVQDSLLIYDVRNPENIHQLSSTKFMEPLAFAITADDKYLYASGCYKNKRCDGLSLFGIEGDTLTFIKELDGVKHPSQIVISPDGNKLAYGSILDSPLILTDISDKQKITRLDNTTKPFYNRGSWKTSANFKEGRFSADSRYLYIASGQSGLLVFDTNKNTLNKVQQTSGRHWAALTNNTGFISSFDVLNDTIYLSGKSDEIKSEISSIKGFEHAYFWQGNSLAVATDGSIITLVDSYGERYDERCVKFIKILQEP